VRYRDEKKLKVKVTEKLPQIVFPNTILSDTPIHASQDVYYYEVKVKLLGFKKQISIGMGFKDLPH